MGLKEQLEGGEALAVGVPSRDPHHASRAKTGPSVQGQHLYAAHFQASMSLSGGHWSGGPACPTREKQQQPKPEQTPKKGWAKM